MLARTTTALVFFAVFFFSLYSSRPWAPHILFAIVTVSTFLGVHEFYKMARLKNLRPSPWPGQIVALAFLVDAYFFSFSHFVLIFIACFWALLITQVFFKHSTVSIANTATSLFGCIYVGLPMAVILCIFKFPQKWFHLSSGPHTGGNLLLFLVVASWMTDIGGLLVGKPLGRHKMTPHLSPNKSWEGLAGGFLFSILAGVLLWKYWPGMDKVFTLSEAVLLPLMLSIIGVIGDLAESAFKRDAQIKDSGQTYTGHGGMLDIIDSMLLCAPVFFFYLEWIRPLLVGPGATH